MSFIPWAGIFLKNLQLLGNVTNKEWREEAPGGEWVSIISGGANGQFMPSDKRAEIKTNWLQDAGSTADSTFPLGTTFERRMGDSLWGDRDYDPNQGFGLGYTDVRANPPAKSAQFFGGLTSAFGSYGGNSAVSGGFGLS